MKSVKATATSAYAATTSVYVPVRDATWESSDGHTLVETLGVVDATWASTRAAVEEETENATCAAIRSYNNNDLCKPLKQSQT